MALLKMLAGDKQSEQARRRRRQYPIQVFCGRNGSGKSLCAVYDTLPDLDAGLPCLSTVRLLDYRDPRPCEGWRNEWTSGSSFSAVECEYCHPVPDEDGTVPPVRPHQQAHPGWSRFTRWEQLLSWRHGPVLMDEITGVASSGDSDLPGPVRDFIAQMRRADVSVRITGIAWIRVNKQLREVVNAVTLCRSSLPYTIQDDQGRDRMWRPRRLSKQRTYDAQSLPVDDHTEHAYEKGDLIVRGRHWIPDSPALAAYDTFDAVTRVGSVTDSGRCVSCAGMRRAPECSCADYVEDRTRRKSTARSRPAGEDGDAAPRPRSGRPTRELPLRAATG